MKLSSDKLFKLLNISDDDWILGYGGEEIYSPVMRDIYCDNPDVTLSRSYFHDFDYNCFPLEHYCELIQPHVTKEQYFEFCLTVQGVLE